MATLYENYIAGHDANLSLTASPTAEAQTFTPSVDHIITSIKARLRRHDDQAQPGTITARIFATDGNGHPTGSALATGTINGNSITTLQAGEWIEITLTASYLLRASTKYAIVIHAAVYDASHPQHWRYDSTDATYTDGEILITADGVSWTAQGVGKDLMFEEWGDPQGSGGGGGIFPTDPLKRVSGIKRSFWAGLGGLSFYQAELALGGMGTTYVSPIGERQPVSAVTPTPLPSGAGYQESDYWAWMRANMGSFMTIFGKFPTYEEWLRWRKAGGAAILGQGPLL